jgi:hypothetical protein
MDVQSRKALLVPSGSPVGGAKVILLALTLVRVAVDIATAADM